MIMTTNFYGLLYLTDDGSRHSNLRRGRDANTTYILCAAFCAKTLRAAGGTFALITNRKEWVASALEKHSIDRVTVLECAFSLDVPQGIPFYQAHFKLDVFSAFAQGTFGNRVGLIDIDTLFLKALPQTPSGSLEVYDISDQVFPAYGKNRVVDDLQHVAGRQLADARWYGGEYICGSKEQFAMLAEYIAQCWRRYKRSIGNLHHFGDEMVTSAALTSQGWMVSR